MKLTPQEQTQMNILGDCVTDMLFYVSQLHLVHWLTLKNHHHAIIGQLYSELEEEVDSLAEQFMGACLPDYTPKESLNTAKLTTKAFSYVTPNSEKPILALIEKITQRANKGLKLVESRDKFSFMRDTIMDIIAILHTAKYQISQQ